MEIQLIVTVQVDTDDDRLVETECESAAKEAVDNALQAASEAGFSHAYVDVASIGYVDTVIGETVSDDPKARV